MKDKEKQIEEMAKDMADCDATCDECFEKLERVMTLKIKERENHCQAYMFAKKLYEQGYRKLPEDSVVLTKEEYEKYQNLKRDVEYSFEYNQGYTDGQNQARKETAEKILTIIGNMLDECDSRFRLKDYQWHKDLCKQFGVEIKE